MSETLVVVETARAKMVGKVEQSEAQVMADFVNGRPIHLTEARCVIEMNQMTNTGLSRGVILLPLDLSPGPIDIFVMPMAIAFPKGEYLNLVQRSINAAEDNEVKTKAVSSGLILPDVAGSRMKQ